MQHTYEITRSDVFWTHFTSIFYSRIVLGFMVAGALAVGVLCFAAGAIQDISLVARMIAACLFGGAVFVVLVAGQAMLSLFVMILRRHEGLLGRHTLVLGESGLLERTEFNESLQRWSGFFKVRQSVGYLYIFITESLYHPVPKRSFASREEMGRFLTELKHRIQTAEKPA